MQAVRLQPGKKPAQTEECSPRDITAAVERASNLWFSTFSAIAETCASQLGDSVAALPGSAALGQLLLMK